MRTLLNAVDSNGGYFEKYNTGYALYRSWAAFLTANTSTGENIKVHQTCLAAYHTVNSTYNTIYGIAALFNVSNNVTQIMEKMMILQVRFHGNKFDIEIISYTNIVQSIKK